MLTRSLDAAAVWITTHRRTVLLLVAVFVALCASQLPRLQTDASPENLLVSYGGYAERARELHEAFGDPDSVMVLLVEAEDATTLEPLRHVHRLSRYLSERDFVVRVESLTVTPLPGAAREGTETLEDLGDLDDLGDQPTVDPRYEAALQVLVETSPEHFPMGLYTVADRVGDGSSDVLPAVAGDDVEPDEVEAIRGALEDMPLVEGRLVSRDRTLAAVVAFLDPALGTGQQRVDAVHEIDDWLAAHPPPEGVRVHPAGIPHVRAAISDAMVEDQILLVPLSLLVCMLLLYVSFRWLPGMVLTLATVGASVVCVLGLMAAFGEPMTILMNTLPTLLIIMGISEAVHVVARYVEEARRSPDRVSAARRTLRQLMIACFLTSFTTAVGFGSLIVAQTDMLRRFGVVASFGVMISYVVLMTFVPAAITMFEPPRLAKKLDDPLPRGPLEHGLVRFTTWVTARPRAVMLVGMLVTAPCVYAYAHVEVDTALRDTFDPSDPVVQSMVLVDQRLDGIRPLEILVAADEEGALRDPAAIEAMERIARFAAEQDGVLRATSPKDFLWETWRRLAGIESDAERTPIASRAQVDALVTLIGRLPRSPIEHYLTPDGRRARVEVRLGDIGAQRSMRVIRAIEERARQELDALPGVRFSTLGEAYIGSHGTDAVVQDMFGSLSLSALIIFATIALLFRSMRLGVLAIPTNVIPQIATVGWMVLRGIPLNASTAIVFSVAIGVSVDLTIHAFARLTEEEARGLRRRAALIRVARGTGRAIVVSCATLVMGFGVLLMSGFVPVRQFGELIAVALAMSLVATLVLQPAMMMLAGKLGGRSV